MVSRSRRLSSPRVLNIEDLRRLARETVPRIVFNYIDGGAEGEITLRENRSAFEAVTLRPRMAVGCSSVDLRTPVLGVNLAMPILLAPVGYCRVMHPDGEAGAARAAGNAGTAYILSTVSGQRLEEVKAASVGPVWFQLYLTGGREAAEHAMHRAQTAGYSVLVITIDSTVVGLRERELREGMNEMLRGSLLSKLPFVPNCLRGLLAGTVLAGWWISVHAQHRRSWNGCVASSRRTHGPDPRDFLLETHEMDS